jgi:hypothetical protein
MLIIIMVLFLNNDNLNISNSVLIGILVSDK